jgi:hypothetical protein
MGRKKQTQLNAAARARAARHPPSKTFPAQHGSDEPNNTLHATQIPADLPPIPVVAECHSACLDRIEWGDDDNDDCGYDGGVSTFFSDDDEYAPDGDSDSEFTESDLSDFDEDILEALKTELASLAKPATVNDALGKSKSKKDWKKAEANRSLGYNGLSIRTIQRHAKDARDRETHRGEVEKS